MSEPCVNCYGRTYWPGRVADTLRLDALRMLRDPDTYYSQQDIARLLRVSRSTVSRWARMADRIRPDGLTRAPAGGRRPPANRKRSDATDAYLREAVRARPEAHLDELQHGLRAALGVEAALSTLCRWLQRLGLTRKRLSPVAPRREDADLQAQRAAWQAATAAWAADDMVFVDETGIDSRRCASRRYGRGPRGEAVRVAQPLARGKRINVCAAVALAAGAARGVREMNRAFVGETVSAAKFADYMRDVVAPHLRPGMRVVMDNASIHRSRQPGCDVAAIVRACGATLHFLPPYSPDLNPIESVFGELKKRLRRDCYWTHAKRGVPLGVADVAAAFEAVDGAKLRAFVRHSGYLG